MPLQETSTSPWLLLPSSARILVGAVCALGGAVIVLSLPAVAGPQPLLLAVLLLLSLPASAIKVSFPGGVSTLTLCQVLDCLALLLLGPREAVLVAAAGAWSQCTFRNQYRNPRHQTLFSIASVAGAIWVAGMLYIELGGRPGAWEPSTAMVPFALAATAFFVANSTLIAAAVGLSTEQSVVSVWHETFLWSWPTYLYGAGVAAATVTGLRHGGWWLVPLLAVALLATFQNLRVYLARSNDAITDPLTGLPNQRFVLPHLTSEIARALRNGTRVGIVLLDLDGFKSINDTYGHPAGDTVLRHVAECLRRSLRASDVCARHGGDEFLVVLPSCGASPTKRKSEELQAAVAAMQLDVGLGSVVTPAVSVGTAVFPDDAETLEGLLEIADARMYRNKFGPKISLVRPRAKVATTVSS